MEENNINLDPENIYSKILDKEYISLKLNQINLGTKKLISNNTNFKDYSKEYEEITKIKTFKYPDEEYFPLLKNEEYISLVRTKYSYDSTKNKIKRPKPISKLILSSKTENPYINSGNMNKKDNSKKNISKNKTISPLGGISNQKDLKSETKAKKNMNYYLSEESDMSNKNTIKIDSEINSSIFSNKNNRNINVINNKDFIASTTSDSTTLQASALIKNKKIKIKNKSMNYYNNAKNKNIFIIKNSLTSLLKHKKIIYNNRVLLRDILLQEKNYFKLKYDEKKIFLPQEHYNDYIKLQMMLVRTNRIKLQHPPKFEKIFENSKYGKPKLTLNSIVIDFQQRYSFDNKNFNLNEKQVFNIPFEYIPVFYFHNLERLKEILMSIFYLNETFTTFSVKYENLGFILRASEEFKENKDELKDSRKDLFKKAFTYKLQISHSQTLNRNNNILKSFKKTSKSKDIFKLIDIYNTEYNFNTNRNNEKKHFNNKNIFEFIWITSSYKYLVTLKMPEISFKIKDIEIKKDMNLELLFFLMENNFKNWDFYIIEYLFSFYDFILTINSIFSTYKIRKAYNLGYYYDSKNKVINLTREKKVKYSKKNTKLEFIFTNDNLNNYIKILHNYKIFVFNKRINPFYQFCFHLNFIQMKALYIASKKQGIKHLIEKIIIFDKENMKIKLNYEYLNNFCKDDLYILQPLLQSNIPIKANKYSFSINDTKFGLFYPILESIKFNENAKRNENCFVSNLEEQIKDGMNMNILDTLLKNNDIYKWPILIQFIDNKEKIKKQKRRASLLGFDDKNNQNSFFPKLDILNLKE